MCGIEEKEKEDILNWWKASRELKISISVMSCGMKANKNWKVFSSYRQQTNKQVRERDVREGENVWHMRLYANKEYCIN